MTFLNHYIFIIEIFNIFDLLIKKEDENKIGYSRQIELRLIFE